MSSTVTVTACASCGKCGDNLKACTACKTVKYCNRDCQIAHRPMHKKACNKVKKMHMRMDEGKITDADREYLGQMAKDAVLKRTEDPLKNWVPPEPVECPVCMVPLEIQTKQTARCCLNCSQSICQGCIYQQVEVMSRDIDRETASQEELGRHVCNTLNASNTCPFCRQTMGGMHGDTRYLTQMANKNKPAAMCQLGHMYLHGESFVKDESAGLKWLERAADAGGGPGGLACRFLGEYYLKNKDNKKSLPYLQKSVQLGHVPAYFSLGMCQMMSGKYEEGVLSFRKSMICGLQDNRNELILRGIYRDGLMTKDEYEFTLRANQKAINECKSKGRVGMEEIQKYIVESNDPLPFPVREMSQEEFENMFEGVESRR